MSDSSSSSSETDNTQKALITVGVLGGCILVAIVVAKIVDYCYDHHVAISDDASDISEHTRDLIRSRLAVTAFRSKRKAPGDGAPVPDIIRIWSAKAKESRKIAEQRRAQDQAKTLAVRADLIIRVEEASGEAKLKASQAAPSATLTVLSETSAQRAGPSENKEGSKGKSQALIRPELKKTLTGLDSSSKIDEAPAVVAVSAAGNASALQGKGSASPALQVKEASSKSSPNVLTVPAREDAVEVSRTDPEGNSAAPARSSDSLDGSKLAESKSPRSTTPNPSRPVSKLQGRSPSPKAKPPNPYQSKTEGSKSATASSPTSKANSPDPPKPKTEGPKTPGPNSLTTKAKSPGPPKPKPEGPKTSSPTVPASKAKSLDHPKPKTEGDKSPRRPVNRSPSPPTKPIKQTVQNRSASPTKPSADTKKTEPSKDKGKSPESETPTTSGAKPAETPVEEVPSQAEKPDSSSPPNSTQPRPTSSISRKFFTTVHPTDHPTPAKPTPPSPELKPAGPSPPGNKKGAVTKPRPKSFHVKEGDHRFSHMPQKLSNSVALYGQASTELDKHKAMVSQRKAAASPTRAPNQSPPPAKKMEQSPIVLEAAARKARVKSAKP
ncbi:hypothetical protein ACOMHN_045213 [Nucella lapillus]